MVKTPRMRHSKPQRDPVTIDLGPGEVSRVEKEKAGAAAKDAAKTTTQPAGAAPETADAGAKPGEPKAAQSKPSGTTSPDKNTMAGSSASGAAFGRGPEKASAGSPKPGSADTARAAPPARAGTTVGAAVAGGIVGAAIALLAGGGLQFAGLLPSPGSSAATDTATTDSLAAQIADLKQQVAKLADAGDGATASNLRQAVDASTKRIDGLSASLEQVRSDVATLKQAVETGAAGDGAAGEAFDARIKALESSFAALGTQQGDIVSRADLEALDKKIAGIEDRIGAAGGASAEIQSRITAVESNIAALSARVDRQAEQPQAALAIAASALKAAVERGGSLAAEIETFAAVAPDAPELADLRALARKGVPSRAQLAAAMPRAADAMVAAAHPVDENAGYFDRLLSSARSLVSVRPIGNVEGDTPGAAISRMEAAVKDGDLADALKEYETLPEAPKAAGADFADKLRTRLKLEDLVDKALAGALKAA